MTGHRLEPIIGLLELVPSAGRLRCLDAIGVAGELGPLGLVAAGAAPSLGMAAYHVRELVKRELVVLTRTEPRRGAVAHFYRVTLSGLEVLERVDAYAAAITAARVEAEALR